MATFRALERKPKPITVQSPTGERSVTVPPPTEAKVPDGPRMAAPQHRMPEPQLSPPKAPASSGPAAFTGPKPVLKPQPANTPASAPPAPRLAPPMATTQVQPFTSGGIQPVSPGMAAPAPGDTPFTNEGIQPLGPGMAGTGGAPEPKMSVEELLSRGMTPSAYGHPDWKPEGYRPSIAEGGDMATDPQITEMVQQMFGGYGNARMNPGETLKVGAHDVPYEIVQKILGGTVPGDGPRGFTTTDGEPWTPPPNFGTGGVPPASTPTATPPTPTGGQPLPEEGGPQAIPLPAPKPAGPMLPPPPTATPQPAPTPPPGGHPLPEPMPMPGTPQTPGGGSPSTPALPPPNPAPGGGPTAATGIPGVATAEITGDEKPFGVLPSQSNELQELSGKLQSEATRQLDDPSVYDDELFEQALGQSRRLIDEDYETQLNRLDADLARRGLGWNSSTYAGNREDLAVERGRAMQDVMTPLLRERAVSIGGARQAAFNNASNLAGFRAGTEREARDEVRGERGYTDNLRRTARDDAIQETMLGEQLYNTRRQEWDDYLARSLGLSFQPFGGDSAGLASAAQLSGDRAAAGNQQLAELALLAGRFLPDLFGRN